MQLLADGLPSFKFTWSPLHTVWNWKGLESFDIPPLVHLSRVHAVNFFRSNGIWVKWKQYMTSEEWSRPVLLIPPHEMRSIAEWRPEVTPHQYSDMDQRGKITWLEKFEAHMHNASGLPDHVRADIRRLKDVIAGKVSMYQTGPQLDRIIDDLVRASSGDVYLPAVVENQLAPDTLAQYFAGVDHPEAPVDTLISVPKRWEPTVTNVLMVGAMILCKSGLSSIITRSGSSLKMPFLMAMVVDCVPADPDVIVQYWAPPVAQVSRAGGGKKKMMIDLFGDWAPFDTLMISEAELVDFPDITVKKADILEVITLTGPGTIPYTALDKLRLEHDIDVTGISFSQTHLGHLYRAHVLTTNK